MTSSMVLVLLATACAPPPPGGLTPDPPTTSIRVMTYNVLGAQADAAVYNEHAGWAARLDQLQPDVVVVQEAQSDDVAALRKLTRTGYTVAAYQKWACDLKADREGVAILVKATTTVVVSGGGTNVGGSCTDPTMRRVLVWADLEVDGSPVRVYGTHLTAGGGAAAQSRTNQIGLIRARIAADHRDVGDRWLLAGDMNFVPGSADYQLTLEGSVATPAPGPMLDTFAEVHPAAADPGACPSWADTPATQSYLLSVPELVRSCGYTAGWAKDINPLQCEVLSLCTSWEIRRDTSVRNRIDMVLRPAGGPFEVARTVTPNRSDADWASPGAEWFHLSDHLPYVVDLDASATISPPGAG
jgi:endonuclease/exonuclease/phosphatase family metal-dependent hydrolase